MALQITCYASSDISFDAPALCLQLQSQSAKDVKEARHTAAQKLAEAQSEHKKCMDDYASSFCKQVKPTASNMAHESFCATIDLPIMSLDALSVSSCQPAAHIQAACAQSR